MGAKKKHTPGCSCCGGDDPDCPHCDYQPESVLLEFAGMGGSDDCCASSNTTTENARVDAVSATTCRWSGGVGECNGGVLGFCNTVSLGTSAQIVVVGSDIVLRAQLAVTGTSTTLRTLMIAIFELVLEEPIDCCSWDELDLPLVSFAVFPDAVTGCVDELDCFDNGLTCKITSVCGEGLMASAPRARAKATPKFRPVREVIRIANICAACPYFRLHAETGGRCTHRKCGCSSGLEPVEIGGITLSGGLLNLIQRGNSRCPDARW